MRLPARRNLTGKQISAYGDDRRDRRSSRDIFMRSGQRRSVVAKDRVFVVRMRWQEERLNHGWPAFLPVFSRNPFAPGRLGARLHQLMV